MFQFHLSNPSNAIIASPIANQSTGALGGMGGQSAFGTKAEPRIQVPGNLVVHIDLQDGECTALIADQVERCLHQLMGQPAPPVIRMDGDIGDIVEKLRTADEAARLAGSDGNGR